MKCQACGFERFPGYQAQHCCMECRESDGGKHSVPCQMQQAERAKGLPGQ